MSKNYERLGNFESAFEHLFKASEIRKQRSGENDENLACYYNNMTLFLLERKN